MSDADKKQQVLSFHETVLRMALNARIIEYKQLLHEKYSKFSEFKKTCPTRTEMKEYRREVNNAVNRLHHVIDNMGEEQAIRRMKTEYEIYYTYFKREN